MLDPSVGRSVALVPAAAAEAPVQTLAQPAQDAADTGADQEEDDTGQDQPDPDGGTTLAIRVENSAR